MCFYVMVWYVLSSGSYLNMGERELGSLGVFYN